MSSDNSYDSDESYVALSLGIQTDSNTTNKSDKDYGYSTNTGGSLNVMKRAGIDSVIKHLINSKKK